MTEGNLSPLLSIGIPTFNRAAYLDECLQSIILSSSRHQDQVEILVSDNASTDNTGEVVKRLQTAGCPIRYVRQSSNIGWAANFRAVAENASGKYVWIFGDDDKMRLDAVGAVLKAIELGADAVICNTVLFSRDLQTVVKQRFIRATTDIAFANANHVMCRLGAHPGYISSVILKRHGFLDVPLPDYMSFTGDGACFLYAAYCAFQDCGQVVFLAQPIVLNRGDAPETDLVNARDTGNCGKTLDVSDGSAWNRVFLEGFSRAFQVLETKGYSKHAVDKARTRILLDYILPRLLLTKNRGSGSRLLTIQAIKYFKSSWALWLLFLPLAPMPAIVLRGIKRLRRGLSRATTI